MFVFSWQSSNWKGPPGIDMHCINIQNFQLFLILISWVREYCPLYSLFLSTIFYIPFVSEIISSDFQWELKECGSFVYNFLARHSNAFCVNFCTYFFQSALQQYLHYLRRKRDYILSLIIYLGTIRWTLIWDLLKCIFCLTLIFFFKDFVDRIKFFF